jgi:type II secretory pathway pseudopilin PulG
MTRAFTLLEVLLVIAMLTILGVVLGPILGSAIQSSGLVSSEAQRLAEARNGMERMVKEIKLIPNTSVLANIGTTNLQFQYPTGTNITYSLNGTNLLRNSDILVGGVSSLTFTYYDASGATTTITANVRSIGIQFTAGLTLQTRVFLRNTGNNYENLTSP